MQPGEYTISTKETDPLKGGCCQIGKEEVIAMET